MPASAIDPAFAVFRGGLIAAPASDGLAGEDRALAEARRAQAELGAAVGLAVIAPGEDEDELPGTVFFGAVIGERQQAQRASLPGDRNRMRNYSVIGVLNFLRKTLAREPD